MSRTIPIGGIAGIVANGASEVDSALAAKLRTVEIRADLLLSEGMSREALLACVRGASEAGLDVLFTARHPSHGGRFEDSEQARAQLSLDALTHGAKIVDAEYGSEAAAILKAAHAPLLLSHHDFEQMLDPQALHELTSAMLAFEPAALKVVPTGASLSDAATMLEWTAAAGHDEPPRIGFAMGAAGAVSRILALSRGAPVTYASFGASVAPGQVALAEMQEVYRVTQLDQHTRVFGVAGTHAMSSFSPFLHNAALHARGINAVYVPLQTERLEDLWSCLDELRIDGFSVTVPFKESARAMADQRDDRSDACGASNTIVVRRGDGRHTRAFNTDFDGVTVPLAQHLALEGARVAVLGNGGAARGAIMALKEKGALPTVFYRSAERGAPVAQQFDIPGRLFSDLDDSFDAYINATTLGMQADDPSPAPAEAFCRPTQVAFDMIYQVPQTRFLRDAGARDAIAIHGSEMLTAQGVEQFKRFTDTTDATLEEFNSYYASISHYRG